MISGSDGTDEVDVAVAVAVGPGVNVSVGVAVDVAVAVGVNVGCAGSGAVEPPAEFRGMISTRPADNAPPFLVFRTSTSALYFSAMDSQVSPAPTVGEVMHGGP